MTSKNASAGLTIVVLTYNRRELLLGCLESLFAQADPGVPLQFIVVDDGSTDGTGDLMREVRRHTTAMEILPPSAQRDRGGAEHRHPQQLLRVDRHRRRRLCAAARLRPDRRGLFPGTPAGPGPALQGRGPRGADSLGRVIHAYREASVIRRLTPRAAGQARGHVAPAAGRRRHHRSRPRGGGRRGFRREVFARIGVFDESFARGEDTEFTRRLRAAGIPVHIRPHLHIGHRLHSSTAGGTRKMPLLTAALPGVSMPQRHASRNHPPLSFRLALKPSRRHFAGLLAAWQASWPARFLSLLARPAAHRNILPPGAVFSACVSFKKKIACGVLQPSFPMSRHAGTAVDAIEAYSA